MDVCIVENGRVFASGISVVTAHANVLPFIGGMPIEGCVDIDELTVQDFLQANNSMCCGVQLKACG